MRGRTVTPVRHERVTSRSEAVAALVRLTRPWFWPLGWAGAYPGAVLATRDWWPFGRMPLDALAAAVVLGPLVWCAVLAVNDLHDLRSDRRNPRKAMAPLVTGELTPAAVRLAGRLSSTAAVLVALAVGPVFAAGTAAVLLLGWLYSAPPARLKSRAGAEVAVNAAVVGVFAPLAGWSMFQPVAAYPPALVFQGLLVAAALYLPTTVMDVDADRAAGDSTAAVRWSPAACRRLGAGVWAVAIAGWVACCHLGVLVVPDGWLFQDLAALVLLAVYVVLTRRPTIAGLAVVAGTFAVPALDFLAAWVGS